MKTSFLFFLRRFFLLCYCRFCFGCTAIFAVARERAVGIFSPITERMSRFGNRSFLNLSATLTLTLFFAVFGTSGALGFRPFGKLMSESGDLLGLLLSADLADFFHLAVFFTGGLDPIRYLVFMICQGRVGISVFLAAFALMEGVSHRYASRLHNGLFIGMLMKRRDDRLFLFGLCREDDCALRVDLAHNAPDDLYQFAVKARL